MTERRMSRRAERDAWTAYVDGGAAPARSKYGNERTNGFASKREAEFDAVLAALEQGGRIRNLQRQVRITLVEGQGRIRPICYVADWIYEDERGKHVVDAKGYAKNPVYRLKKKLLFLLHGIEIEEV